MLDRKSRSYIEGRVRAGVLESGTVTALEEAGVAKRLHLEGISHEGFDLAFDGSINRVASGSLAGWNFAGNYTTTVLIVAATLLPGILLGTALPDTLLWATAATAALLGVTEIKRRDL